MKSVNWGMIGCGDVTEVKSGPGLYKADHSNLMGVYNRTYEKAVDYTKRHGIKRVYHTAEELLNDKDIDIVYIATPPISHKQYAVACLEAGKIPYIEKPVAMNYQECLEIKQLLDELKIPVYAAFYRRGLEKFIKIKELLDQKVIGEIRYRPFYFMVLV
ncbi:MAG: Oxidoreductase [Clostridia bacterium]|jgi:predicted dehydrogenase|nr:Oxidoreductase [Clostridia bacterium]